MLTMRGELRRGRLLAAALGLICLLSAGAVLLLMEKPQPVRIALIDTGVSPTAIARENLDGGKNYILPDKGTGDTVGHGTALASIIVGSQAADIRGLCPQAVLVPLVWYARDDAGATVKGRTDMVAQAVREAVDVYGCRIISLATGSTVDARSLREAVAYAVEQGALVITCAGNANETAPDAVYYPGAYEATLCVGAVDGAGNVAGFSQRNDFVDLVAPGVDCSVAGMEGELRQAGGTSYAAGYVVGAAARLMTRYPGLTAQEVTRALTGSARDLAPAGRDPASGFGLVDVDSAEKAAGAMAAR